MFCSECGKEINDKAAVCIHCGVQTSNSRPRKGQESAAMRMLLPVDRSGFAIIAGYLGLLSVLVIFAPFALLFGILGIWDINKNEHKHGMGRAVFGTVMGALFTVLLVFMLLLTTVAETQ